MSEQVQFVGGPADGLNYDIQRLDAYAVLCRDQATQQTRVVPVADLDIVQNLRNNPRSGFRGYYYRYGETNVYVLAGENNE